MMKKRKKSAKELQEEARPRSGKMIKSLRGFKDILPGEQPYWEFLRSYARDMMSDYGFERIDLPVLEPTSLFEKGTGKDTDIVEKEMFAFTDTGGDNVSLRPEFTPGICRAYIEHGMVNKPQPVKLYTMGPVFRHERPQAGRYRQFNQLNLEVIGEDNPFVDAQLIVLAYYFLQGLGIKTNIQINSIGSKESRADYRKQLVSYFKQHKSKLSEDSQRRLTKNPLRILDSKDEEDQKLREDAPQIIDYLNDDDKNHFIKVLEYLDELEIPYSLNPYLVRGLDYYSKTVFEIWPEGDETGKHTLVAGGRYDGLVELLGGRETPACGCAFGMERIIPRMKEAFQESERIFPEHKPQVFIAQLGDQARVKSMRLFEDMRLKGFKVAEMFVKDSLKGQLEYANKLGVSYSLILGQKEIIEETILLRDMDSGVQEVIPYTKILAELEKKLTKNGEIHNGQTN